MQIPELSPILGIPGYGWYAHESRLIRDLAARFQFTIRESWPSIEAAGSPHLGQLALYVTSTQSNRHLRRAIRLFRTLLCRDLLPPLARIIVASSPNIPLALIKSDGSYNRSFIDSLAKYSLPTHYTPQEELRMAWIRPPGQMDEFRLERHLWFSTPCLPRPNHLGRTIPLSDFINIQLGARMSNNHRSSKQLQQPHNILELSNSAVAHYWSNAQVFTVRNVVVRKELLVRPATAPRRQSRVGASWFVI